MRSCHQVCDPHNRDHVPIVVCLLFRVLIAGPDEVLLGRKDRSFLVDPHLSFGDNIGGLAVFDPGCMMMSRIETVLKPGIRDGLSP